MRWIVLALLTSIAAGESYAESAAERFRALHERDWSFRLEEFPELATSVGDHRFNDRLTRVAEADLKRRHEFRLGVLKDLDAIDPAKLDVEDQANYAIFRRQIEHALSDYRFGAHLIPMNSDWGFHIGLARLPSQVPLHDAEDYENYLSRLSQISPVMDEYITLMRRGLERGMSLPKAVLSGREAAISAHLVDVDDSVFFAPFKAFPDAVAEDRREALVERARAVIGEEVIPAYQRFFDFFTGTYRPGARETLGASELPDGEAYYAAEVRYYTTLDLSPQEIHDIGLAEVARIRAEMDAIIEAVGFEGDYAAFLEFLRSDEQFYAKTPRELLMRAAYIAKKMDGKLPALFGHLPRQPYGVEPVPDDLAPFFTTGRYVPAPLESTRPGLYWVNTHDLPSRTLYTLPALSLHEAVPGHHLQNALAKELGEQPPFRRNSYISAFGEGWGLYSEFLGVEAGIYETPYEDFGRLTYEMWRACRLVVDTGVHAFGWSRQRALDYLGGNTALSLHEVTTEVDRYISWPGQALSYKLGELKIKALRARAEERLGADFDVRAFHDVVLAQGSVPLPVLEQAVARWLERQGVE